MTHRIDAKKDGRHPEKPRTLRDSLIGYKPHGSGKRQKQPPGYVVKAAIKAYSGFR